MAQPRRPRPGARVPREQRHLFLVPDLAPAVPAVQPERPADARPCSCGHELTAHTHYRSGADCGLCSCSRFAAADRGGLLAHLLFRSA